jgi:predicted nucleotidyltransferase
MQEIEQNRQAVIHRFAVACQADVRVVATFLGGSDARGATDAYSDIDFGLITLDESYNDFFADRKAFLCLLGEPIFLEVFSDYGFDIVFFTFPNVVECELVLGRQSQFTHMHVGPYKVLLDKMRILTGAVFSWPEVAQIEQSETLRGIISWFWHDLYHHFMTPLARGQMWSAYGGLQDLRLSCVNLVRLKESFMRHQRAMNRNIIEVMENTKGDEPSVKSQRIFLTGGDPMLCSPRWSEQERRARCLRPIHPKLLPLSGCMMDEHLATQRWARAKDSPSSIFTGISHRAWRCFSRRRWP